MTRLPVICAIAPLLAVSLLFSACGSANNDSYSTTGSTKQSTSQQSEGTDEVETIGVTSTAIGKILTADDGRTVYLFEKDADGKSACYDACAVAWPPVETGGAPTAKGGVQASKLGTTKRKDGAEQVTYAGQPLYYYVRDTKTGQTSGNGLDQFGAEWYALDAAGMKVEP